MNCLRFIVSTCRTLAKCSGANVGIPSNLNGFAVVSVSPMEKKYRIKHTDDVSRIRLVHDMTLLRHHLLRLRKLDLFIAALHMCHFHAGGKLARADAHKRNSVTVCLVHVCLNLEYKRRNPHQTDQLLDIRLARQRRVSHL